MAIVTDLLHLHTWSMLNVTKILQDLHLNIANIGFAIQVLLLNYQRNEKIQLHKEQMMKRDTSRNYIQYALEESSTSDPEQNTLCTHYLGFLPRKVKDRTYRGSNKKASWWLKQCNLEQNKTTWWIYSFFLIKLPLGISAPNKTPVSTVQHRATFSFVYPPPPVTWNTWYLI